MNSIKLKYELAKQRFKSALIRRLLGEFTEALLVRSQTGLYAIDPEDHGVGGELRTKGKYGLGEIARLAPHINLNSRVLVVGAHVGTLAIPLSRMTHSVVAIEANPKSFNLLQTNIGLNNIQNCRALNIAASSHEEEIEFVLNRANSGGSKRQPKIKSVIYYYDNPETIKVKAYGLDDYLAGEKFDLIVMDIEGSEYFALQGMQKILSGCETLIIEFLPHHLQNVSGVSAESFISLIEPHFLTMDIPSQQTQVPKNQFIERIRAMYLRNEEDEGLIFSKIMH